MRKSDLKSELKDYLLKRGRFKRSRSFVGMSASQYPGLFVDFFETLDDADKKKMVAILLNITLVDHQDFESSLTDIVSLLTRLAIHRQSQHLQPHQEQLEKYFTDEDNLRAWAESSDVLKNSAKEYLESWRFALPLFCILKRMGSAGADKGYSFLVNRSKSEHFIDALRRNREIIAGSRG